MLIVINYSDNRFEKARKYNTKTAYKFGADKVIEYSPKDMPIYFKKNFPQWCIENDPVIGRYCLWRPFIILDAIQRCKYGDYICYCDAGTYFNDDISKLVKDMELAQNDIMVFGLPFIEYQWTKRDVFIRLNADIEAITNTPQILSTIFLVKKTEYSLSFLHKYADIAKTYPELFTDSENVCGKDNYKGFIANRHNQSVLSVLAKKEKIEVYRDPSEYGIKPQLYKYSVPNAIFLNKEYNNSNYPQIIVHHRSKNIRIDVILFAFIRKNLPPYIAVKLFKFGHTLKYLFSEKKHG